jgi:AAA15 family ATPase/GTPase
LLGFELENFRSFRDRHFLNLTRSIYGRNEAFPSPDVVPAIAIFGANASGKSNLLRGISVMFSMIRSSATSDADHLPYTPYLLGDLDNEPTRFEASTRIDNIRYDYGFTYNAREVLSEWLYAWPTTRRRVIFERGDEGWYFGDSLAGPNVALSKATRSNALFLSTARLLNHEFLTPIHAQLAGLINVIQSEDLTGSLQNTLRSISSDAIREAQVRRLMSRAEFGVSSLAVQENQWPEAVRDQTRRIYEILMPDATPEEIQAEIDKFRLLPQLQHLGMHGEVAFPFGFESTGTRNFLALLGPILDRLSSGGVLVVDEIDTSLHPRLVSELVRIFQDPEKNPRQAQLLLSTHDVTVIMNTATYHVLDRDQIWFVEKGRDGASRLYPLMQFKPRKSEVFSRSYLMGAYGAVPEINEDAFWGLWSTTVPEGAED